MKTTNANIRKVSHDLATVRAASSVSGASEVTYSVVPNAMPASQEAAPYLGRSHVAGSCSQDELAADVVANGCQMNVEEVKRVWNGLGAYLLDRMPEAPRVFDLGFARFWPVIGGTFPAADAEFDPERNELYVAAAPSAAIRNALAGGTPTSAGVAPEASVIYNVQRQGTDVANTIRSGEPFWILGRNLTLGNGDEHAELQLPDSGGTIPVTLEVQIDEDGSQRIVGRLSQPVDACEGANLKLWTHGLDPDSSLKEILSKPLTVLAGDVPPGPVGPLPVVTQINAQGVDENPVVVTSAVTFIGEHFDNATLKVSYDDGQGGTVEHDLSIYAAGSDDTVLITEDDWYQEAGLSSNFKALTFTITNANGSTSVTASYQPE